MLRACLWLLAIGMVAPLLAAAPEPYPSRPIHVVVPYPPGGGTDIAARAVTKRLAEQLGQPVVIDNKPGAGTLIGAELVAKAAPDGYTLLFGSVTHTIAPALYKGVPFDARKDFTPITQIAVFPFVLVVHPSVPAQSVGELVAFARRNPGKLRYASVGNGTGTHLAGEMFKQLTGTDIVHVPYKGTAAAMPDVLSGTVEMMFMDTPPAIPQIDRGSLRALAVSTAVRSPSLPGLPTVAEAGVPGFEFTSWWGVLGPARMAPDIVARLNREIATATQAPDVRNLLQSLAAEPVGNSQEAFARIVDGELARFSSLVRNVGLRVD
jgi:tripartite-type tricarboxylate transporter receptor subunit TctC